MQASQLNEEQTLIEPLHLVRSQALENIIFTDAPAEKLKFICGAIEVVHPKDLEIFLLEAFRKFEPHSERILEAIKQVPIASWEQVSCTINSLIWAGLNRYVVLNKEPISELTEKFKDAWVLLCDSMVGFRSPQSFDYLKDRFLENKPEAHLPLLSEKDSIYNFLADYLQDVALGNLPNQLTNSTAIGDLLYWMERLDIQTNIINPSETLLINDPLLSLSNLCSFTSGFYAYDKASYKSWIEHNNLDIEKSYLDQTESLFISKEGDALKTYFYYNLKNDDNDINKAVIKRVNNLRELYPSYSQYQTKGIGIEPLLDIIGFDPTDKNIPIDKLPLRREVFINSTFKNLVEYDHLRPKTWIEYSDSVLDFRQKSSESFGHLVTVFSMLLAEKDSQKKNRHVLSINEKLIGLVKNHNTPSLPCNHVDPYGFSSEGTVKESNKETTTMERDDLDGLSNWRKVFRDYSQGVKNTLNNLLAVLKTYLDRTNDNLNFTQEERLFIINLSDCL